MVLQVCAVLVSGQLVTKCMSGVAHGRFLSLSGLG